MDNELRLAGRAFAQNPTKDNKKRLRKAQRRAGWVEHYVPCKRCHPESRCVRSHGQVTLCDVCSGNGWTHAEWGPPE